MSDSLRFSIDVYDHDCCHLSTKDRLPTNEMFIAGLSSSVGGLGDIIVLYQSQDLTGINCVNHVVDILEQF